MNTEEKILQVRENAKEKTYAFIIILAGLLTLLFWTLHFHFIFGAMNCTFSTPEEAGQCVVTDVITPSIILVIIALFVKNFCMWYGYHEFKKELLEHNDKS